MNMILIIVSFSGEFCGNDDNPGDVSAKPLFAIWVGLVKTSF